MTWPMVKLGDVVDIKGGGTPSKETPEYWGGDIPWVSVKDFKSSLIDTASDYITTLGLEKSATNLIPSGTIVVPTRMAVGKVAVLGTDMAINQDLKALIIKNDEELDKRFLLRFLESRADHILKFAKGATVKGITLDVLKDLDVPLPPLEEQKRIAAILDKADAIRRKRQQAIKLADDFLRAVFLDMFGDPVTNPKGWEVRPIDEVCDDIVDCVNRTAPTVSYETPYKMIRTTNVRNYSLDIQNVRYVDEDTYTKWVRRLVPKVGDLIFTREAPAGEAAVVNTEDKIFLGQRTMHFRPNQKLVSSDYLMYELMNGGVKRQTNKMHSGSTVTHLSVPECKKFRVRVPPRDLQELFEALRCKILDIREKADLSTEMPVFETLSQKAFSGEL